MKARLLLSLTALLLALTSWAKGVEIDGIHYQLDSSTNTATVVYTGSTISNPNPPSTAYKGNITIPASVSYGGTTYTVTSIGDEAFKECTRLTSISIPASVTTIGDNAFFRCTGLTSLTIPASVTAIGDRAFEECRGLTSISIPASVTAIRDNAFDNCTGLTSINIPASVTTIGNNAFFNCYGLTGITIPSSVTSIGSMAFGRCTGLTSIKVEAGNTAYDSRENCNALIETASNTLVAGCMNTTIPNSVTTIGAWAFNGCTGLTSISIPSSVTSIEYGAFGYCTGLTSISIPNSVTSIGASAFSGCTSLTDIYALRTDPAAYNCSASAFIDVSATLHVPIGSKEAYAATAPWSYFQNIVEHDASGIEPIGLTPSEADAASYYNLQGQRIARPQRGQIVIQRNADGTGRKVLVK